MIQAAIELAEHDSAVRAYAVLDRAHLSRMTFDDRGLEREVLQLFERQAELLMTRMRNSGPAAIATLAHTLKGSAVGIGAARVAQAAVAGQRVVALPPVQEVRGVQMVSAGYSAVAEMPQRCLRRKLR